jgi:cysteine-rich repeat protein
MRIHLLALTALFGAASLLVSCGGGTVCGNGRLEPGEACDDGNRTDGDGCEASCQLPASTGGGSAGGTAGGEGGGAAGGSAGGSVGGGTAGGTGGGDAGGTAGGMGGGDAGASTCGDGQRTGAELCDDGDMDEANGCTTQCRFSMPAPHCGDGTQGGSEACDDGNLVSGDGCEVDCTVSVANVPANVCGDGVRRGSELCDDGNTTPADGCEADCSPTQVATVQCPAAALPASGSSCTVVPGSSARLLVGTVLLPGRVLNGGQVLVSDMGTITCVGCDCLSQAGASQPTTLLCGDAVISPGLINGHDHLTFPAPPYVASGVGANGLLPDGGVPERYEHRHDWRVANDGHTRIPSTVGGTSGTNQFRWNELRQLLVGTTSISGSGGAPGLLRNLDAPDTSATGDSQQGLGANSGGANYDTFPLRDTQGNELVGSCAYPGRPNPATAIPANAAYLPHIAEGIELSARNEFLCLSGLVDGGVDVLGPRTAIIHGVGVRPAEVRLTKLRESHLIWSPRSNVVLYGETAQAPTYHRMGVNLTLGTDWVRSGSMNLMRELACADYLSQSFYARYFSAQTLWRMVTVNAAVAQQVSARVGVLSSGRVADISIYRRKNPDPYRSVITSNPEDTVLTMRGGKVLVGDQPVASALSAAACETLDVCGSAKALCLDGEGTTLAALQGANTTTYPLFFCNAPPQNEPTCTPMRGAPWLFSGNPYTGVSTMTDSDGDGLPNAMDNCPTVFNPRRPMDGANQADTDGDGVGDICDVCPLDANATTCSVPSLTDVDGDGVANGADTCPADPDAMQLDADSDGKGDACDPCPMQANPGAQACPPPPGTPATIYQVKALASPLVGSRVQLTNVLVTASNTFGFFAQVHENDPGYMGRDFSGIFVFYPGPQGRTDVVAGDRVTIPSAVVADFRGQVQLNGLQAGSVVVTSRNQAAPAPTLVMAGEVNATASMRARALEGVLITLAGSAVVVDVAPAAGAGDTAPTNEFTVSEMMGGPQLRVNDYFHAITPFPAVGDTFVQVRGILQFRNDNYKLEPRDAFDSVRPVTLASAGPSEQFLRFGATDVTTFPAPFRVRLSSPALMDTLVSVTSLEPSIVTVADGGGLLFSTGQFELPVRFSVVAPVVDAGFDPDAGVLADGGVDPDGGVADAGSPVPPVSRVGLLVTFGSTTLDAGVRLLGPADLPTRVTLSPAMATVVSGSSTVLTVELDVPAPVGGTAVMLAATGSVGTVPMSVVVPENQLTATVSFASMALSMGSSTVTASLGPSMATSTVNVIATAGANNVVISEVQVGVTGSAADEFVELYNPTAAAVNIGGWVLQYRSAMGTTYQNVATIPAGTMLAPRRYFLITSVRNASAAMGFTGMVASDLATSGPLGLSGTAGHVRIGPSLTTALNAPGVVDLVGWGSTAAGAEGTPAPVPSSGPLASIERKANAAATAASMGPGGTDEFLGNGQDTGNNQADFVLRATRDPQNSMSAPEP